MSDKSKLRKIVSLLKNDGRWWDSPPGHATQILSDIEKVVEGTSQDIDQTAYRAGIEAAAKRLDEVSEHAWAAFIRALPDQEEK